MKIVENCEIYEDEEELEKAIKHSEPTETFVAVNEAESDLCSYTLVRIKSDDTFLRLGQLETRDEAVDALIEMNNL